MEYEKYAMAEEDEYTRACIDHRIQYGISTKIDIESIDCEYECKAHETGPLNPKNEV